MLVVYSDLEENSQQLCHDVFYECTSSPQPLPPKTIGEVFQGLYKSWGQKGYFKVLHEELIGNLFTNSSKIQTTWGHIAPGLFSKNSAKELCDGLKPYGVECEVER